VEKKAGNGEVFEGVEEDGRVKVRQGEEGGEGFGGRNKEGIGITRVGKG